MTSCGGFSVLPVQCSKWVGRSASGLECADGIVRDGSECRGSQYRQYIIADYRGAFTTRLSVDYRDGGKDTGRPATLEAAVTIPVARFSLPIMPWSLVLVLRAANGFLSGGGAGGIKSRGFCRLLSSSAARG